MSNLTGGIGFIGTGNMAEALIGGLIRAEIVAQPADIAAFDVRPERLEELREKHGLTPCASNAEVLERAQTVVFAVKPQNMADVVGEIAPAAGETHLLISICAGISTGFVERRLPGTRSRVVRVMPNTPALIGLGISALCKGAHATDADLDTADKIFQAVGKTVRLDEKHLNAVTALSGSGPAYFFHLIECLIEAGRRVGLPPEAAEALVKQTALGAAQMCADSDWTPAELREAVTSPKGTTWAALETMKARDFSAIVAEAIEAATNRAAELGADD